MIIAINIMKLDHFKFEGMDKYRLLFSSNLFSTNKKPSIKQT